MRRFRMLTACFLAAASWLVADVAAAQAPRVTKADAPVVVEGIVQQVFRRSGQDQIDYVVLLDVQRAEARRALASGQRLITPSPGDTVYVHVFQKMGGGAGSGHSALPVERGQVRAYLTPRAAGGWDGAFPDWFELASERPTGAAPPSSPNGAPVKDRPTTSGLGMTFETLRVRDRLALRVKSVERGSPAHKAGIESGDVIVAADGAALTSADQLDTLASRGKPIPVVVVDVNTNRTAQVEIQPESATATRPDAPPAPPAAARSLGISAEPVTVGQRTALKITRVDPNGLAGKAGIEVNDVILAANGVAISAPDQLASAIRKTGQSLALTIRDSRTGKDSLVEIAFAGGKPASPPAADGDFPLGKGKFGAVMEVAFYDDEAAVKITEVEAGSAAARAGLRAGWLIVAVNGKPTLHPNDVNDAVRSGATHKFTVVDPATGRKGNVEVSLGS